MRIESVGLEHHCHAAFRRLHIVDWKVVDENLAVGHFLKSCDHSKQRGFSASGRPHEDNELAVRDFEINVMYDIYLAKLFLMLESLIPANYPLPLSVLRSKRSISASSSTICGHEVESA